MGNQRSHLPPAAQTTVRPKRPRPAPAPSVGVTPQPVHQRLQRAERLGHDIAKVEIRPPGDPGKGPSRLPPPGQRSRAAAVPRLRTSGPAAIQLQLDPLALAALIAAVRPALIEGGLLSLPRCLGATYAQHDQVPGDAENAWMARCLTKCGTDLGALDARIRQALVTNPSYIEHLTALSERIWTAPIAAAFRDGLLASLRPAGLLEVEIGESIQVMGGLPATSWKTDDFLTLDQVVEAAGSSPDVDTAYGERTSYVDLVRIRAFHRKLHPPQDLEIAATPTAGARRARFSADATGYGVPSTTPELEQVITGLGLQGPAFRQQHLEQRELSKVEFKRDDVVFVPVGHVANGAGEIDVRYARANSFVPVASLIVEAAPQTGALNPEDAVPLFPQAGPSPEDVGQQALGDCYFLAALASIAKSKPAVIREVVKDLGGGNFAVRFFRKRVVGGKPPSFVPEWVGVDSEVYVTADGKPVYAKGNKALWPAVVEKGYAVWKGQGSYEAISGGFSNDAFEQVLGLPAEKVDVQALHSVEGALGTGTYSQDALGLFRKIKASTEASRPVALDTKEWGSGGTGLSAGENTTQVAGLASSHAYSVFATAGRPGVDKYLYVTVRNPWGHFGRQYEETGFWKKTLTPSEKVGGTFNLELSDLMRYASNLHFV